MNKQFELPASPGGQMSRPELLAATDAEIDAAVKQADPMTLRGLIYQLTGDEELAKVSVTKKLLGFAEAFVPTSDADAAIIQKKTAAYLKQYRDSGAGPIGPGPSDRLLRSIELAAGEPIKPDQVTMWIEELGIDPWGRGLKWPKTPSSKALADFKVAVIGAGMNGLGAAVQLKQAGIPYVMLEKNPDIGGTWWENRYPGARVDSPSKTYTHIFGADYVYPYAFCPRDDNQRYFRWVTDTFKLRDAIQFNTQVKSMVWDEAANKWSITTQGPDGEKVVAVNAIINATGIFNIPNVPSYPGADSFKGDAFHTARVPLGYDFTGKRVAVVGTGCSGYQMIPELAKTASHITVYQRRPQWLFATPSYLAPLPDAVPWLDRNLPYHTNYTRFRLNWLISENVIGQNAAVDPNWKDPHTRSEFNQRIRDARIDYLKKKLASRPDLIEKMIPPHPPFSARPVLVDEEYNVCDVLMSDTCTLVTTAIDKVAPEGIVSNGELHRADIIIWATGFHTNDILSTIEVRGRGGVDLQKFWSKDGCRAYAGGTMVPGFPNFFMLYGPNTNLGSGGGIVNIGEVSLRFALDRIGRLILDNGRAVEVTPKGFDEYNQLLDKMEKTRIYVDSRAQNYYVNEHNRSAINCPLTFSTVWKQLVDVPDDHLAYS